MKSFYWIFFLFIFLFNLEAKEYFVNPSTGDDLNDGSETFPWKSVAHGFSVIQPGDVLNLYAATYQPMSNIPGGEPGLPITIKSVDGDRAVISNPGINNGILITNDHVIIDGIKIHHVKNNCINIQANHITIRNCILHDSGLGVKTNTDYFNHHILIEYCSFYNFSDIAIFPDAVDKLVIRNNILYNGLSVMMDPGGVRELLIENNFVTNPKRNLGALKIRWGNVEEVTGPNCDGTIVRNNIFLEGNKYNILLASANGAMVYSNTMINNLLSGSLERAVVYMQQDPAEITPGNPNGPNQRNMLINNIFQVNGGDSPDYNHNALVEAREDMTEDIKTNEFDHNLYYKSSGSLYIVNGSTFIQENDVIGWGEQFDMHSIIGQDPELNIKEILESPEDYMPTGESPAIDKGRQLTVTIEAGNSDTIKVEDSRYFYGGYGMINGDRIIIGDSDTATVIGRDITENTITINKTLTWDEGDSVSLVFAGIAPDMGAYEKGIDNAIGNAAGAEEVIEMINEASGALGFSEKEIQPRGFHVYQNYPNPFNPITVISWQLAVGSDVELSIYSLLGQKVVTLVNQKQAAGMYQVEWDGSDLASGVYYYQLEAGEFRDVKKMVLLR
jgi:hypothetical protein